MEIPNESFEKLDEKYPILSDIQCGLVCSNNVDCNGFQFQDSVCTIFRAVNPSSLSGNLTPVYVHESQIELLEELFQDLNDDFLTG